MSIFAHHFVLHQRGPVKVFLLMTYRPNYFCDYGIQSSLFCLFMAHEKTVRAYKISEADNTCHIEKILFCLWHVYSYLFFRL